MVFSITSTRVQSYTSSLTLPISSSHTGGSTTSGSHGGGSKCGGEELSTPAVKRTCVREENILCPASDLRRETVHGESVAPVGFDHHQHYQFNQQHRDHPQQFSNFDHFQAGHSFLQLPYIAPVRPVYSSNQTPGNPPLNPLYLPAFPPTLGHPGYHTTGHFQPASPSYQLTHPPPYVVSNVSYQVPFHAPVQPVHLYQFRPKLTTHSPSHQQASAFLSSSLPPPHPDDPLGKYALFLRGYYTQHHTPCTKWPQLDTRKYINLAVINNVYANREDLVQFRRRTIRGSIDDI